jgi:hemin uptake protein HemP
MITFDRLGLSRRLDPIYLGTGGGGSNSPLIMGDDGILYRLKMRDNFGVPLLDQEAATFTVADNPTLMGDDGVLYRLRLRTVDGELLLDQEVA